MPSHKKRLRAPFKPALQDASIRDRGVVVSASRMRWKNKHVYVSENMIRMTRFVWMRHLTINEKNALHGGILGACLRAGLVTYQDGMIKALDPKVLPGY